MILTRDEIAFLDVYCHEGTELPFGGPATAVMTSIGVQNGDTLKSIAQKLYGNAELWYDLYYLNRDRLGPMGHLFPGQILVLPTQAPGEHSK